MAEQDSKQPEVEIEDEQQEAGSAATDGAEGGADLPEVQDSDEIPLEVDVARLQEDLNNARDAALRAQADAQNIQRRAEQDVERARKFALEQFAGALLPVVDNLERALESAAGDDAAVKAISEGVELTLKSFLDVLGKYNIEQLDPHGEPFDPNLHEAMTMVENNEVEPNTVIAVMQKGYTLNGRLVRPARVMVSKSGG